MEYYNQANLQLKTELPYTAELFTANQGIISRLNAAGITLASAGSAGISGTQSKVARADEIEQDLRHIARTARLAAKKVQGFQNTFILPRGALTYQQLIEYAESFIADAVQYKDEFAKRGLTEQFFTDLATDVAEFKGIAREQADAKRTSVGANADAETILEEALDIRGELKTAIENHYRSNPARLAEWLTATHIERKKNDASKTTGNNPPEQPPTA
jgi:hypothetical protein